MHHQEEPGRVTDASQQSRFAEGEWVSRDGGLVDRRAFSSREIYDRELATVFSRSWLFLGHESQIPNPGDFVTTFMGETPVIVARAGDSTVHVHVNSCRHRGLRVCRSDSGNAATFQCPYHGWTYGLKGELRGWPNLSGWTPIQDKSQYGLVAVRCESYKGLLFGNFDPQAASLRESLGDIAFYMDSIIDRSDAGIAFLPGIQKRRVKTNWKLPSENLIGDRMHGHFSHRSAFELMSPDRKERLSKIIGRPETSRQLATVGGHGGILTWFPDALIDDPWLLPGDWTVYADAYGAQMRPLQENARERLGQDRFHVRPNTIVAFPNLTWLPFSSTLTVAHPRGPGECELWSYSFYDRAWPEPVRDELLKNYYMRFGPSGTFENDDIENWEEETYGARATVLADYPYTYEGELEQGMGAADARLPGMLSTGHSDAPQRNFYRHWQGMLK